MQHGEPAIRAAVAGDAEAIASLLAELGYPSDRHAVAGRLAAVAASDSDAVFVAVARGVPVGLSTVHIIPLFHRPSPLARITAFVVAESARRKGIGAALVRACQQFAASHHAERLEVTSGDARSGAHAFYLAQGFHREGVRFSRPLLYPG